MPLLLGGVSFSAFSKDEYRKPALTWRLWGGDAADFDSPEAAFSAFNAADADAYDTCSTKNCGSCVKHTYTGASKLGPYPTKINGQLYSVGTSASTMTSYSPACTVDYGGGTVITYPPSGPTTVSNNAGIAAVAIQRCPNGWAIRINRDLGVETIDGVQVPVYEQFCGNEIPEPCKSCTRFGNPVDAVAGTKLAYESDYSTADGLLRVGRRYSSVSGRWTWTHDSTLSDFTGRNISSAQVHALQGYVSAVPAGMYYYYGLPTPPAAPRIQSFPLVETNRLNQGKEVSILLAEGRVVFSEITPGAFTSTDLSKPELTPITSAGGATQWLLRHRHRGFDVFDNFGNLIKTVQLNGQSVELIRQSSLLTMTSIPSGRVLVYSTSNATTPVGSYDTVTLPDGAVLRYKFNSAALVTELKYPDLQVKTYLYDEAAATGTTDPTSWLTGILDELGVRYSTYAYDGVNPKSTELASGVNKYSFAINSSSANTRVTTPISGAASMGLWWERGPDGERRVTQRTQFAGSGSTASTTTYSYDASGNVASKDDSSGGRVCYVSDTTRNVEKVRVEGLSAVGSCAAYTASNANAPTGSRKVSTEWHPDWRLSTKVAEPGKITTSIYNGQPDPFNGGALASCAPTTALLPDGKPIAVLCKHVEQATTDTDGHLGFSAALQSGVANRQTSWTYNQWGQVLTEDGPRTDVNDVTTYAYYSDTTADHMPGDLQSVTNAAGKVSSYSKYNKHGQVLESSDANGVLSVNTYDLRQRLLSSSVGGQTTSYSYDAAGQLKKVTLPDTSWVGYDYDDAHRQVAVYDNRGNRTEYQLDNAGNRTSETTKDPNGALKRQLTRSIDALGRVQQTTGRE